MPRLPGTTIRMSPDEWERLDSLASRARCSRAKVLRVALAHLDLSPEAISDEAWRLPDHKFVGGSPAASEDRATEGEVAVT
jgi:hypothetical protein